MMNLFLRVDIKCLVCKELLLRLKKFVFWGIWVGGMVSIFVKYFMILFLVEFLSCFKEVLCILLRVFWSVILLILL